MKINYIGIVAAIIALISLALPWWTMAISDMGMSGDVTVYTYDAKLTMKAMGLEVTFNMVDGFSIWYGYVALALIIVTGIAGMVGSVIVGKTGKMILVVAGILALLSIIIFAAGLQSELSAGVSMEIEELGTTIDIPEEVGLFSSGTLNGADYSTYLTFGFWLALVAAVIAFISLLKHPMAPPPAPPEAPPTPES